MCRCLSEQPFPELNTPGAEPAVILCSPGAAPINEPYVNTVMHPNLRCSLQDTFGVSFFAPIFRRAAPGSPAETDSQVLFPRDFYPLRREGVLFERS